MDNIYRIGQVVDNNDPKKLGRVKVRIFPEFDTLEENSLPWADPMNYDDICLPGQNVGVFRIPEVNSFIVVRIDTTWQNFLYSGRTPNRDRTGVVEGILEDLSSKIDTAPEYPQPLHLMRTKDGTIAYHNTDTGELGIVNAKGVHLNYDKDGNFVLGVKDGFKFTITADGSMSLTGGQNEGGPLVFFNPLKEILEKLLDHIHVAPNGPTTAAQESNGTPLSSLKSKINEMETK